MRRHSPVSQEQEQQEVLPSAGVASSSKEVDVRTRHRIRLDRARRWWLHGGDRQRADESKDDVFGSGDSTFDEDAPTVIAMEDGTAWLEGVHRDLWKTTEQQVDGSSGECPTPEQVLAGERLALLLLQSSSSSSSSSIRMNEDRNKEADAILNQLGYACRLARGVLNYPDNDATGPPATGPSPSSPSSSLLTRPCLVWDDFLPLHLLEHLQRVFCDPHASYWTDHHYQVEPHPSPYFSYLVPLPSDYLQPSHPTTHGGIHRFESEFGGLGSVIALAWRALADWKGLAVASSATMCELWAHNRPSSTGHQLHWDTDNEGRDAASIRHPIATAILCLDSGGFSSGGGPTLVTHQRLAATATTAISKAWLVCPATNRLILMDGRVLHGVIPGKRPGGGHGDGNGDDRSHNHRVTLMLAFWKRIRCRNDEIGYGAARPFPILSPTSGDGPRPHWASQLIAAPPPTGDIATTPVAVAPHPISHAYERIPDGTPWNGVPLPAYDRIFQGV